MKRVLSLFLALTISLSIVIIDNKTSYASTDNCINSSSYTGTYDGSYAMEFTINNVNRTNNTFTGHVKIENHLYNPNRAISGNITFNDDNYVCNFGFS